MSNLVLAEQYRLTEFDNIKQAKYKQNGNKILVAKKKMVDRTFAEQQNESDNCILFVFFEDETQELLKQRQKNIEKNMESRQRESVGMADLVEALVEKKAEEKVKKPKKEQPVKTNPAYTKEMLETKTLKELQGICDSLSKEYHHKAGEGKLIELILS